MTNREPPQREPLSEPRHEVCGACESTARLPLSKSGAAGKTETSFVDEVHEVHETEEACEACEVRCSYLSRVSAYHDGELAEDQSREVADHLGTCRACAEAMEFFDRVSGAFAAAPPSRMTPEVRSRLRSLASGIEAEDTPHRRGGGVPAHVRWVRRLTAAAAALFVVAACKLAYDHTNTNRTGGTGGPAITAPVAPVDPPARVERVNPWAPSGPPSGRRENDSGSSPGEARKTPAAGTRDDPSTRTD